VRAIENVLSHINESTGFFSDQPELLTRLRELESEVDAMLAREASDGSASAIVATLVLATAPPPGAQRTAQQPPRAAEAPPAEEPAPAEEFDHEIANIYSEEATELLESAQASLTVWHKIEGQAAGRRAAASVAYTQGGARMAGITHG